MSELSDKQVKAVEQAIFDQCGHSIVGPEFLDHCCCAIEACMEQGVGFEAALAHSMQRFEDHEMKTISRRIKRTHQYYRLKQQPLGWLTPALVMGLLFIVVNVGAQDRPSRKPTEEEFRISSAFGKRRDPIDKEIKLHRGVDLVTPIGTPIVATAEGVVEKVQNWPKAYGIFITLSHDDGYETVYAQLSEAKVKVGDTVKKGQLIALSGNSGRSTAPHLHYEVLHQGKAVDPALYFGEAK